LVLWLLALITFTILAIVNVIITQVIHSSYSNKLEDQQQLLFDIVEYQQKITDKLEMVSFKGQNSLVVISLAIKASKEIPNPLHVLDLSNSTLYLFPSFIMTDVTEILLNDCKALIAMSHNNFPLATKISLSNHTKMM
jgi:uncharacterized membrane protein required for colicin V production